jgi:hypothetical protein
MTLFITSKRKPNGKEGLTLWETHPESLSLSNVVMLHLRS